MKRPLLITTSLIQPVLQDQKSLTSRLLGLEKVNERPDDYEWRSKIKEEGKLKYAFARMWQGAHVETKHAVCPYGIRGDLLWIRETWAVGKGYDGVKPRDLPELPFLKRWYRADGPTKPEWAGRLRASIHMPAWFSRITLVIDKIEPRRVNTLTELECKREGVPPGIFRMGPNVEKGQFQLELNFHGSYRDGFKYAFATINGLDVWDKNPWVWLISFHRLKTDDKP